MRHPLLLIALGVTASASNIILLPAAGAGGDTALVNTSSFTLTRTTPTVADAFLALGDPEGTRVYILGKSGTVVVLDAAAGFSELGRYSLASQVTSATITPDGKKMLVTAGELRIIDLSTTIPSTVPSIPVGSLPNDVAVSLDSKRAYVVSTASQTLSAVDLTANRTIQQVSLMISPQYVSVSPNGLIYVAAPNRLLEFDDRDGLIATSLNGFTFEAIPGKPQFTSSGHNVVMLNTQSGTSIASIIVDLAARAVIAGPSGGIDFDQLEVTSETAAYARGKNGLLYQLGLAASGIPSQLNLPGLPSGIVSFAASPASPYARYLYAATSNQLYRIPLAGGPLAGPLQTLATIGKVQFNPNPSSAAISALQVTASPLPVLAGITSYPLTIRAIDANGLPIANATITYTPEDARVSIQNPSVQTNINGIATTRAMMPTAVGKYKINATSNGVSAAIEIPVVSQVGTDSLLTAVSGNGQIIATTSSGTTRSQPYQVRVRDVFGNPAPTGTIVNWQIQGIGVQLTSLSTPTDANGIATTYVDAGGFTPASANTTTRPFKLHASVDSETLNATVDLYGVVYPSQTEPPSILFANNLNNFGGEYSVSAGSTIANAFSIRAVTGLAAFPFVGIPNVGVRIISPTGDTPAASCQGSPISDSTGLATCNLVVGSVQGPATLRVFVGESSAHIYDVPIRVTPGAASQMSIVQGDGQTGAPGMLAPKALIVHIDDPFGNPLPAARLSWTVVSGDATLENSRLTADSEGNASTQLRFGNTSGAVKIRATSGTVSVDFALTVASGLQVSSVVNGASFREGVAPCSVAVIKGSGFTNDLSGVVSGQPNPGLPYTLAGVTVQAGGINVPIFYVSNIDGTEQIGIQVPCELAAGNTTVSVTALGRTSTTTIAVADIAPGVFETEFTAGMNQGVVMKANGSYVSPQNPAVHGETLTGYFTGLLQTAEPRVTNVPGVGQPADISKIIIGLNNQGMPVISAQYAPGMIGVYVVQFRVDPIAGSGDTQAYAIGVVDLTGKTIYGNSTFLPVRAN